MKKTAKAAKMKQSLGDRIFIGVSNLFLILLVIVILYPVYFVVIASVTEPAFANNGTILLYPKGFNLLGYKRILQYSKIWIGYGNTIIYTVLGTALGVTCVVLAGYALSRTDLPGRGIIMKLMVFTMYFSGGLIPCYMVIKGLNLTDTRTLMVVMGSISVYNIIVTRSFMQSNIPKELWDAATIDGCGNGTFFVRIVLPLSKAIIAVMVLYIAVGYWNSYFNAMIYLTDRYKYPLQIYLREILMVGTASSAEGVVMDPEQMAGLETMSQLIKYGVIVVSTAPIICVYPFIQKYFVKGVMIGSVKG